MDALKISFGNVTGYRDGQHVTGGLGGGGGVVGMWGDILPDEYTSMFLTVVL